jgi:predicted GH43/DUF377 family glycosyl hydrolase
MPDADAAVRSPIASSEALPISPLTRRPPRLAPDSSRVIARLFVPDEAVPKHHSRARGILNRVLELTDAEVDLALADLRRRFTSRHRDLDGVFERHFDFMVPRTEADDGTQTNRRLLIGAFFTAEYSTEGAALTNPSMVPHPDQSGLAPGELRFLMSARAVGEGHFSCIAFRTGTADTVGNITVDEPGPYLETGEQLSPTFRREAFRSLLRERNADNETADHVLGRLDDRFEKPDLMAAIADVDPRLLRRLPARETIQHMEWIAFNHYGIRFGPESRIDERLLAPVAPSESNGMEDARFTRFVDDDGSVTYRATYTAYDGISVTPQLIETDDFRTFSIHQLSGPAAKNKGMALFPRRLGGQYVSLSRYDRERSSITRSDDGLTWMEAVTLDVPLRPWELIQAGNCGPPIETDEGWLVLTHGVGPMRTYGLGALLLDLDDPSKVLASTDEPLLLPNDDERNGYVPNVVYSCGGLRHGTCIVLPYGLGDQQIAFAVLDLPRLFSLLR